MSAGREEQFRACVVERRGATVRTALALTGGDPHQAEDLVQTTPTRLYVARPAFQRTRSPRACVRRALLDALTDEERRPWRRRERTTSEVPESAAPGGAVTGGGRVEQVLAETADLLGCTRGRVESQSARALDELRERLGPTLTLPDDQPDPAPLDLLDHRTLETTRSIR